ncbi:MAG: protein kinase [Planctomycetota bacterium]
MTDPDRELLAEMLLQWEELWEHGQDTPAAELAKDHPRLVDELGRRIAVLKTAAWLDTPLEDDSLEDDEYILSPPTSPYLSKTFAGRYRLDALIAEGGFAQVFRAFDTELERKVAVKVPKPSRLESKDDFQAEARRVARLTHEGIVPVFDVGLEGDTCFIVTEFIEGGSLADRLSYGTITPGEVIRWATEIGEALDYAHLHGIVHLDIKPANLLLDDRGRARLADFGIARSPDEDDEFGTSLGTLRYMSPEQVGGLPADHRSDIYSLAVVIHEALSGDLPFSPYTPNLRKEIATGSICLASTIPAGVQRVLSKALSKSPGQRHASATEFATTLKKAWDASQRTVRWPWIFAVGIFLAVGAITFIKMTNKGVSRTPRPSVQQILAVAKTNMLHEQYADARSGYTQALQIAPANCEALKNRGLCHLNLNLFQEAVADLTKADKLSPNDPATLKLRASAYVALRDYPRAIADLRAALALMPNASEIKKKLAMVYSMQSTEQLSDLSVEDKLTRRITIVLDRNTLFENLEIVSRGIGVPITLLVEDLQIEGITKNQNIALAEHDKTADDILRTTLRNADPKGRLVYFIRTQDGKDSVVVTTRAAAKARGEELPAGF